MEGKIEYKIFQKIGVCTLQEHVKCEHQCDCKMAQVIICGCNPLSDIYKKCEYKTNCTLSEIEEDPNCRIIIREEDSNENDN